MMWVLHIVAIIFFIPALFLTIPLHIIINNQKPKEVPKEKRIQKINGKCRLI